MAVRNIVKIGDDVLRQNAAIVTVFDERLKNLVDDMVETMFEAKGVGLAAPQIGVSERIIVVSIDNGKNIYAIINPVIIKQKGLQTGLEGCLSVPNQSGSVQRPRKVTLRGQDIHGNPIVVRASDYLAVAFCHEIDHLDGVLFVDKVIPCDNI